MRKNHSQLRHYEIESINLQDEYVNLTIRRDLLAALVRVLKPLFSTIYWLGEFGNERVDYFYSPRGSGVRAWFFALNRFVFHLTRTNDIFDGVVDPVTARIGLEIIDRDGKVIKTHPDDCADDNHSQESGESSVDANEKDEFAGNLD